MAEPRIPPLDDDNLPEDLRALVEASGGLNIFRVMAHHPDLLRSWIGFGSQVLYRSSLPERERELVILRTGWRCGSDYEFGQHTIIGRAAGLGDQEIERVATEGTAGWSARDALFMRAVDELVADHEIGATTWAEVTRTLTTDQAMDLVFLVGQYALVSSALRTFGVEREEGVPGFPS
jgi:alkylhydroperoxidase family enzyme